MFAFIGNIGPWELVFILLVALIVVGPGKLPEVARTLGKTLTQVKHMTAGVRREFEDAMKFDDEPQPKPSPKIEIAAQSSNDSTDVIDDSIDVTNDEVEEVEEVHDSHQ
ncbi:MAG TPA: twin-arginine translocase TatA/TatE family subunit [Syntrophomonadaceae bacterium]|nr:twin-arginine translocase TatA/TatE family subunit [Syntrophomonadaceae bacterium]